MQLRAVLGGKARAEQRVRGGGLALCGFRHGRSFRAVRLADGLRRRNAAVDHGGHLAADDLADFGKVPQVFQRVRCLGRQKAAARMIGGIRAQYLAGNGEGIIQCVDARLAAAHA